MHSSQTFYVFPRALSTTTNRVIWIDNQERKMGSRINGGYMVHRNRIKSPLNFTFFLIRFLSRWGFSIWPPKRENKNNYFRREFPLLLQLFLCSEKHNDESSDVQVTVVINVYLLSKFAFYNNLRGRVFFSIWGFDYIRLVSKVLFTRNPQSWSLWSTICFLFFSLALFFGANN